MALVELIPTDQTDPEILDQLEDFVTTALGKGVVRAKDTPNFIANRVGIAGMLATMIEAEKFGLSYDVVDDLTGKKMGRASSGTFRTADVVGLDTMAHVIKTLQDNLADDPFFSTYATPKVVSALIEKGALGQKSGAGFYKKVGKNILRLDPATQDYVPGGGKADEIVARMLKKPPAERLKLLRESSNPQAQFLWAILRDSFHYSAVHLGDIAESAREVDFAMRWGFGMKQGPFELWQQAGWGQVAQWVKADIDAGKALSKAPLPSWVFEGPVAGSAACTRPMARGARRTRASSRRARCRSIGASISANRSSAPARWRRCESGTELFSNDEVRVWTLDGEVLIASITAKLHLISPTVTEGLLKAVEIAEQKLPGAGDLVARRRLLGRRQPRGADAGVHEERRQGHRAGREEAAGRDAAASAMRRCRWSRRSAAWRLAAAANWRSIRRAGSRRWKATWGWSRSASACCPAAAA